MPRPESCATRGCLAWVSKGVDVKGGGKGLPVDAEVCAFSLPLPPLGGADALEAPPFPFLEDADAPLEEPLPLSVLFSSR